MLKKSLLLGCFCTLALASGQALAGDFSGTVSGTYLNVDLSDVGVSGSGWGGAGELQTALGDSSIHLQADGAYNSISISGLDINFWNAHGSLFMPFESGRVGATGGYYNLDASAGPFSGSGHLTNYGAFGEFWAGDMVTLGIKGGGISGEGASGYYVGGEAVVYPIPDLALNGSVSQTGDNGITEYTASLEYLVSEDTPISVTGGYTFADLGSIVGNANVWFAKVTFYFGDDAAKTLVDHHRTGNLGWAATTTNTGLQF